MRGVIEAELTGATTAKGSNGLEDKDGNNESAQRGGKGEDRDSRQATGDRRRQSDCLSTCKMAAGLAFNRSSFETRSLGYLVNRWRVERASPCS
jgi:hypothetical protein